MNPVRFLRMGLLAFLCFVFLSQPTAMAQSLNERNEVLFEQLRRVHGLSEGQMDSIRTLFRESGVMGQGNPAIAKHPMTPDG
jgi:hypothetical protein